MKHYMLTTEISEILLLKIFFFTHWKDCPLAIVYLEELFQIIQAI